MLAVPQKTKLNQKNYSHLQFNARIKIFSRTLTAISTSIILLTQFFKHSLNTFLQKARILQTFV